MIPKIQCLKCSQFILASCCAIVGMFLLGGMQTQPRKSAYLQSDNTHTVPQQDFRITFKYFNYRILGLTHHKNIF